MQSILSKGLVVMALLAMALAPLASRVVATGAPSGTMTAEAARNMADMPCCPSNAPADKDCSKSCPLMALCANQAMPGPAALLSPLPAFTIARLLPREARPLAGLDAQPGRKPPKSNA